MDKQQIDRRLTLLLERGRVLSAKSEAGITSADAHMRDARAKLRDVLSQMCDPADGANPSPTEGQSTSAAEALRAAVESMSFDEIEEEVREALNDRFGGPNRSVYLIDCYPDSVVYEVVDSASLMPTEKGEHTYSVSYSMVDGEVVLGTPVEVERVVSYVPVSQGQAEAKQEDQPNLSEEFVGETVPLLERAVRSDGTVPIRVIAPGWGSSGHYSEAVLKRDGPKVFRRGLQSYWNHPSVTEERDRPERSLSDLAGVLESDARWETSGPVGPGLYADLRVFEPYRKAVDELAPHIGVSIRASGVAESGEAEGRKGKIIQAIDSARSVDFVTVAGAGGKVAQLFESKRVVTTGPVLQPTIQPAARVDSPSESGDKENLMPISDQEAQALREARTVAELEATRTREANAALQAEVARLREAQLLGSARTFVADELARIKDLPDLTRERLQTSLQAKPVVKDGSLDHEAFASQIAEAAKAEVAYLNTIMGRGQIKGLGASPIGAADTQAEIEASFRGLGLSESQAKTAAQGR